MNYLIDKHRLLFVHMPKCGGTSILNLFKIRQEKYYPLKYNDGRYDFAFTIVRNPYTRLVSAVNFNNDRFYKGKKHLTLHSLMDIVENDSIRCAYHDPTHTKPLERIKRSIIPMTHPDNRVYMADLIYRFENFEESVKDLLRRINLNAEIPHSRPHPQTSGKLKNKINYKALFDDSHIERVKTLYSKDLETFNYSFEDLD